MFCSAVPTSAAQKSPKIVCGLRTLSAECSKLENTDHRRYQTRYRLEIPHFAFRIPAAGWQSGTGRYSIFAKSMPATFHARSFLASPLAGRHARDAAEEPCEIVDVGDAAGCRNILHRQKGIAQPPPSRFIRVGRRRCPSMATPLPLRHRDSRSLFKNSSLAKRFELKSPVSEASMVTRIWRIGSEYELMLRCSTS